MPPATSTDAGRGESLIMPAPIFSRSPRHARLNLGQVFILFVAGVAASLTLVPHAAAQTQTKPEDNTLRKLNESVDALIRKVSPSVVQILVAGYGPVEESHGNTSVVIGR